MITTQIDFFTTPVAVTPELLEALDHAFAKITNKAHRNEIQALQVQLMIAKYRHERGLEQRPDLLRMFDEAGIMRAAGAL